MRFLKKVEWCKQYQLSTRRVVLDTLDAEFVNDYCDTFGQKSWKALGRVLSFAYKAGECDRRVHRLGVGAQPGFPYWVYVYDFTKKNL